MKLSDNTAKLTGSWARNREYSTGLDFQIYLRVRAFRETGPRLHNVLRIALFYLAGSHTVSLIKYTNF